MIIRISAGCSGKIRGRARGSTEAGFRGSIIDRRSYAGGKVMTKNPTYIFKFFLIVPRKGLV